MQYAYDRLDKGKLLQNYASSSEDEADPYAVCQWLKTPAAYRTKSEGSWWRIHGRSQKEGCPKAGQGSNVGQIPSGAV